MRKTDYTNVSQQRCLKVFKALTGHLDGLTITQISLLTDISTDKVTRDLYNLELEEFVERDGELWKHGKAVTQMYRLFAKSLEFRLTKLINEAKQVIGGLP